MLPIEFVDNESFARALHGNRSIPLEGSYQKGDYVILYGKEFPYQYWIKCKIGNKHFDRYNVKKGVRLWIY